MSAPRVLCVGVGGLGSPALRVLVRSGLGSITLLDDDRVEESNLHRQVLFDESDVGQLKVEAAARALAREAATLGLPTPALRPIAERLLPETAEALVTAHDLVLEGADNFATKFLAFDAARLLGRPIVQAGAVRWSGWALASPATGGPCLRCVFEDVPHDRADTCAEAGVVGPVVGVLGSIEAALALRWSAGDERVFGDLWSYDGLAGRLRRTRVLPRPGCPSCAGTIRDLSRDRYAPSCAA